MSMPIASYWQPQHACFVPVLLSTLNCEYTVPARSLSLRYLHIWNRKTSTSSLRMPVLRSALMLGEMKPMHIPSCNVEKTMLRRAH